MMRTKRFKSDTNGSTAIIFALSLVPLMGFLGAAVDYGRATSARVELQRAVDAASIALVRDTGAIKDPALLQAKGEAAVKAMVKGREALTMGAVTVRRDDKLIRVAASGTVRTAVMGVLGFTEMPVSSESVVEWGMNRIELALVLDNTGSMNETPMGRRKIDELKKAAGRLVDDLRVVAEEKETVKVSVVPFDTEVRLDTKFRNESWLRWSSPSDRLAWTGYVVDRDQPSDTTDQAPTGGTATLYPARPTSAYGTQNIPTVRPLTSLYDKAAYDDIKGAIGSMQPRGNTNITLGLVWGLATLSPGAPFTEAAPAGTKGVKKFMVLLTDGTNTQNRFTTNGTQIDARTKLACQAARDGAITVFTIKLVSGNASLLSACATTPDKYYDVTDPSKLEGVFQSIAREISGTRLTH